MKIQEITNPDSPNNEAFEAIVELYYQIKGYITSSGKWFWVWEEGKKQRGYQDIDVLAVGENETLIISVSSNLDDKLRLNRNGEIDQQMLNKLVTYYQRVRSYLGSVKKYKWLIEGDRKVKNVIAYNHAFKRAKTDIIPILEKENISVVSSKKILGSLFEYVRRNKNIKIQDQMLRVIQLLDQNGEIKI